MWDLALIAGSASGTQHKHTTPKLGELQMLFAEIGSGVHARIALPSEIILFCAGQ